jgi:hypothetical protein
MLLSVRALALLSLAVAIAAPVVPAAAVISDVTIGTCFAPEENCNALVAGMALLTPATVACANSTTATTESKRVDEFDLGLRFSAAENR